MVVNKQYMLFYNAPFSVFHAYYQAINTVIQGSAADIMKTAMIHLSTALAGWQDETTRPRLL
jgi:DNA polymerase I-like protein with 3'-5' exonuclease and polymerase domains